VEDTCRLEEELEDNVQQQVMPAMNVGQAGCSTRRRDTARGNREKEEAEAQEELSSWGILLTRSMPHGVSKRTNSLRPGDYSLMIQSFVT